MSEETTTTAPTPDFKLVQVKWPSEPGGAIYSNSLCFQYDGNSVLLTFAQINPPIALGKDEEETKTLREAISSVAAIPVVRLVIPMQNFVAMLRNIHEQMDKIEKMPKPCLP